MLTVDSEVGKVKKRPATTSTPYYFPYYYHR